MIKAEDISTLLGEGYNENARFGRSYLPNSQFEPVEQDDELEYSVIAGDYVVVSIDNIGRFESVITWGGEGDGAEIGNVIKFSDTKNNVQFFEQVGRYSSWSDTYFGEWYEVEPYEKTVIRYRRAK